MPAPLGLWLMTAGFGLWLLVLLIWAGARLLKIAWSPQEGRFLRDGALASLAMVAAGVALAAGGA